MALRLSSRQVTWTLVALWAVAAVVTGAMVVQDHAMDPTHWAPLAVLTVILVAWPFMLGWRPFTPAHKRLRLCPRCGTQWRPSDEGTARCPACGA